MPFLYMPFLYTPFLYPDTPIPRYRESGIPKFVYRWRGVIFPAMAMNQHPNAKTKSKEP